MGTARVCPLDGFDQIIPAIAIRIGVVGISAEQQFHFVIKPILVLVCFDRDKDVGRGAESPWAEARGQDE